MDTENSNKQVKELVSLLAKIDDEETVEALLQDMFTIREIRDLASRLQVAKLLDAGYSYVEIENKTGVSATTIARVSKCLTNGAGGYEQALKLM